MKLHILSFRVIPSAVRNLRLAAARFLTSFGMTLLVVFLGCREPDQIRSYPVAKETKPAPVVTENTGPATDRMLSAILPAGDRAWFFKVVGPIAAIDRHADAINDFFGKLTIADDGRAKWALPAGWQERPGNEMRLATLVIPNDDKPLEMTVNALPWRGTQEDVLSNVNRWRGQLKLSDVTAKELPEFTRAVKAGERTLTVVDLRGHFQGSGMMAPFAGRVQPGGPTTNTPSRSGSPSNLPAGHPPIDAASAPPTDAPPANAAADVAPKFAVPSSWTPLPVPPGGMRKAAFTVTEGDKQALVTVIDFSADAGPRIADPLENVNRWRQEVGLTPVEQGGLASVTESIEIDGRPATYVAAIPDTSQASQSKADKATLAAMVNTGDRIWFIKMTGSRDLVAAQQDNFKKFLQSVGFPNSK
jgi:hypothetical protein